MPLNGTISECIYATAEYREGYYFGTKAARMHRLEAVPFPSKDPRHAGWSDALYDAWSARRLELSRAANRTADCRPGAVPTSWSKREGRSARTAASSRASMI